MRSKHGENSPGVYVTLEELIRLQHKAAGFSFLPRQPVHSLLAGRHASRLRGRGLDFEELRQYRPGDDIRAMDWKATRRTGEPQVRVYAEDRERPVLLVVDQRLSMFFGSRVNMKSVTAAQAAALAAWRVVAAGDRVGAVLFDDSDIRVVRCQRSKKTVMRILQILVEQNNRLGVDRGIVPAPNMLDQALERAVSLAGHDFLVCVISDFFGLGEATLRLATTLTRHNDLLLAPVYDPLARKLPEKGFLVISDGTSQIRLDGHNRQLRKRFPEFLQGRLGTLSDALHRLGVPVLPLNTVGDVAEQVRATLGFVPGKPAPAVAVPVEGSR
ncbi:MAG: DUF58 domain-containing protein [Solidesulfovibrio sp. DCME]|uniref:DUF58 domain-containing protein n=1 Tax=Solidesulfovibrio sp. DCME TaxID=3447380 RepID=UPI003D09A2D8